MARIRSIHPGLFTDEAFVGLSMTARVLYIGVLTECDDHGVFEWKPVTLKMRLMPVDNVDIAGLLREMETCGSIKSFTSGKSYGLVRNFCRYQRPKKPKYLHPMPPELRTYAGLNKDGSVPVLHRSVTGTENPPQREEEEGVGGGNLEEESGIGNGVGEETAKPSRPDLKIVQDEKPQRIDEGYEPSDRAVEYAFSLGMRKADLNSELSKFIATSMAAGAVSFNVDMSFKVWCDRWLEFKLKKDPNWKPAPAPAEPVHDARANWPIVIEGTSEHVCWNIYNRENGLRPLFLCKQLRKDGTIVDRAARCETLFPPGFNDFGERISTNAEDVA